MGFHIIPSWLYVYVHHHKTCQKNNTACLLLSCATLETKSWSTLEQNKTKSAVSVQVRHSLHTFLLQGNNLRLQYWKKVEMTYVTIP